jgi:hypothetical protein
VLFTRCDRTLFHPIYADMGLLFEVRMHTFLLVLVKPVLDQITWYHQPKEMYPRYL